MGDKERKTKESMVDYQVSNPNYGELIVEMVRQISDRWILEQIYRCIKNITKEG